MSVQKHLGSIFIDKDLEPLVNKGLVIGSSWTKIKKVNHLRIQLASKANAIIPSIIPAATKIAKKSKSWL